MRTRLDVELSRRAKAVIQDRISDLSANLATGMASDFAHYKLLCGEIRGLESALGLIEEIMKEIAEA